MKPKICIVPMMLWVFFLSVCAGFAGTVISPAGRAEAVSAGEATSVADQTRADERNILRFGVHVSGMGKLDPHFAAGSQDRALADMVFNGLLRYQPGNAPKIEPDLALSLPEFKMVDGRQVWTVNLRKGCILSIIIRIYIS